MSDTMNVQGQLQEQLSTLDSQLSDYQKRSAELETQYSQLQDRTKSVEQAKPQPPPSLSDWGGIAAAAAIFAASASSRRPLVAGLQAGATALEAQRTNNQEKYAAALEGWYKNMNFALKQEELANKTMDGVLKAQNTTTQQQLAALRALATSENMQRRMATGDMRIVAQGLREQQRATERLGQLQNTMRMQGRKILDDMIKAGKLSPEQYAEAYAGMEGAITQLDLEDPSRTPFVDWYKGLIGGGAVPGRLPSISVQKQEVQNERARAANDWFASDESKKAGAKWKDPVSGIEYTRKQMQQAKEGIKGAMPKEIEDLSRIFEVRPTPGAAAPALPRAQAEGAPARPTTIEQYNALPKGALFIDPDDGKTYRKP